MKGLFRTEALEHRQHAWLGGIQLIRPLSLTVLTVFVLVVATARGRVPFDRRIHAQGSVVGLPGARPRRDPPAAAASGHGRRDGMPSKGRRCAAATCCSCCRSIAQRFPATRESAVKESLDARQRSLRSAAQQQTQLLQAQRAGHEQQLSDLRRELAQMDAEAALHRERLRWRSRAWRAWSRCAPTTSFRKRKCRPRAKRCWGCARRRRRWSGNAPRSCARSARSRRNCASCRLRALAQQGEIEREPGLAGARDGRERGAPQHRRACAAGRRGGRGAGRAGTKRFASMPRWRAWCRPMRSLQAHLYAPSSAVGFVRPDQSVLLRYQAFRTRSSAITRAGCCRCRARRCRRASWRACRSQCARQSEAGRAAVPHHRGARAPGRAGLRPAATVGGGHATRGRRAARPAPAIEWMFEPVLGMAGRV